MFDTAHQSQEQAARDFDPDRRIFTITLGDSQYCTIWKYRWEKTWGEFAVKLSVSPIGSKDGPCYTPAILKGHTRQLLFVERIDIAVLDSDCGHTLDEIAAAVEHAGLEALVHATHSHLTTRCEISCKDFDERGGVGGQGIASYMREKKSYLSRVVDGAMIAGKPRSLDFKSMKLALTPRVCSIFPVPGLADRLTNLGAFTEAQSIFMRWLALAPRRARNRKSPLLIGFCCGLQRTRRGSRSYRRSRPGGQIS